MGVSPFQDPFQTQKEKPWLHFGARLRRNWHDLGRTTQGEILWEIIDIFSPIKRWYLRAKDA